jgi:hypothetical protein
MAALRQVRGGLPRWWCRVGRIYGGRRGGAERVEAAAVEARRRPSRRDRWRRQEGAALKARWVEKKERRGWRKGAFEGGCGGWAMTWIAERSENGTENKVFV